MSRLDNKNQHQQRREHRVRSRISGTSSKPRLVVNISNRHVSAQLVDDLKSKTIAGVNSVKFSQSDNMTKKAEMIGEKIAKLGKAKKINKVVLDRGKHKYHGRIKALAEAARNNGLEF